MNLQQTSLEAFLDLLKTGKVNLRQYQILQILKYHGPLTSNEICELTKTCQHCKSILNQDESGRGLPINCITPRILELRRKFLVEEHGVRFDSVTKRRAIAWKASGRIP
ncbi:hypothetical protein KEJ47_10505 [Candidatus Bathyarchaeota archaeon]|nr:hypothetical protein [Candidatus Bathyarchaeota archaeon]